jgi:hypothetical protein
MKLIGFMGPKGSGKSTGSNYLVEKYGYQEYSFADPLKKICKILFMFDDEQLYGSQAQKESPDSKWFNCSARTAMQFIGTDLLRDQLDKIMPGLGKDVFTYHFMLWYKQQISINPNLLIVISDVRFQNEVDCIKYLGGTIIKINRNYEGSTNNDSHQSETEQQEIISYDYVINNNTTIEIFNESINKIIGN